MAKIENYKYTIQEAFRECFYIVPDYQREYVWTDKEVQQLLEDINEQIDGEAREDLIVFKAPADFAKPLRDLRNNLAQLDKSRFPMMMLEATKKNVPYDFKVHERSMKLALVEAVKPIGWNARGTFNDCVLSYYWIHLSLTFEKFKIQLREAMLTTLNDGLERIGGIIGFKTQIKIDGLPTLADVDTASHNLNSGAMPFTEVMKPFELR